MSEQFLLYYTWPKSERWRNIYTNNLPELGPTVGGITNTVPGLNWIRQGSSVQGWKEKIAQGAPATSNFTGQKYMIYNRIPGSAGFVYWSPPWNRWLSYTAGGDLCTAPTFSDTHMSETLADNRARANLYKEIRAIQTVMSGQVFLGELREALRMIKRPALALRGGLGDYMTALEKRKRGRHTRASRHRVLQDTWLEYSFGWTPLINDMNDARAAYRQVVERVQSHRVRAIGIDEQFGSSTVGEVFHNNLHFIERYKVTKEVKVTYTAGVRDTVQAATFQENVVNNFGLGVREFIPTAWELLPWSFVVDYFTNVGDILSAASTDTSNVLWISKTVRKRIFKITVLDFNEKKTRAQTTTEVRYCEGRGGKYELVLQHVFRSPSGLQLPSLMVRCPGLDSLKWVNLAALFVSQGKLTPYYT